MAGLPKTPKREYLRIMGMLDRLDSAAALLDWAEEIKEEYLLTLGRIQGYGAASEMMDDFKARRPNEDVLVKIALAECHQIILKKLVLHYEYEGYESAYMDLVARKMKALIEAGQATQEEIEVSMYKRKRGFQNGAKTYQGIMKQETKQ